MFPDDTWEQAGISWEFDGVLIVYCLSCKVSAVVVYQSLYEKNFWDYISGDNTPLLPANFCEKFSRQKAANSALE